jgi:hypothetical protein
VERSSCGVLSFATLELWRLKVRFRSKNNTHVLFFHCYNPSLGLATKARACKVAGQEGSPGITPHAPESVRKCEGMNLHTFKGASTLGIGVPMDSRIFIKRLQGSKLNGLMGL